MGTTGTEPVITLAGNGARASDRKLRLQMKKPPTGGPIGGCRSGRAPAAHPIIVSQRGSRHATVRDFQRRPHGRTTSITWSHRRKHGSSTTCHRRHPIASADEQPARGAA